MMLAELINFLMTVEMSASTGQFCAHDHFQVDTGEKTVVKISYLDDYFKSWFLGKTEEPFSGGSFSCYVLQQDSVDGPIINALGGEAKAETTLQEVWQFMAKQSHGEDGALPNNGLPNIFYVQDVSSVLRVVYVCWCGDGWYVFARSLDLLNKWIAGYRVFSRNL